MNLFSVGKIVGCFGVKGYVKIQPATHSPERLKKLREVFLGTSEVNVQPQSVDDVLLRPASVVVKFRGIDDRNRAGELVGLSLFIEEKDLLKPADGEYFIHDILGCEVVTADGASLGVVTEVYKLPAQDVWEIRKDEKVRLIPAVKEFIDRVDTKNRKITVRIIEGLIEE